MGVVSREESRWVVRVKWWSLQVHLDPMILKASFIIFGFLLLVETGSIFCRVDHHEIDAVVAVRRIKDRTLLLLQHRSQH